MKLTLELVLLGSLVFMPFIVVSISHLSPESPFALLFIAAFSVIFGLFIGHKDT